MKLKSKSFSAIFSDCNQPQHVNGIYYCLPANSKPLLASYDVLVLYFNITSFDTIKFNPDISRCVYIKINGTTAIIGDVLGEDGYDTAFYSWLKTFVVQDYQKNMLGQHPSKKDLLLKENCSAGSETGYTAA